IAGRESSPEGVSEFLARPAGFEPATTGLEVRGLWSIRVYQCLFRAQKQVRMSTEDYQNLPISIGVAVTSAVKPRSSDPWTGACLREDSIYLSLLNGSGSNNFACRCMACSFFMVMLNAHTDTQAHGSENFV